MTTRTSGVLRCPFLRLLSRLKLKAFASFAQLRSSTSCCPASAAFSSSEQNTLQIQHAFVIMICWRHTVIIQKCIIHTHTPKDSTNCMAAIAIIITQVCEGY